MSIQRKLLVYQIIIVLLLVLVALLLVSSPAAAKTFVPNYSYWIDLLVGDRLDFTCFDGVVQMFSMNDNDTYWVIRCVQATK